MATKICIFCGCRHNSLNCNNREVRELDRMALCMSYDTCPDFKTFPINHLRYIAHYYAQYERAIVVKWWDPPNKKRFNRIAKYSPISMELSKGRMVKALTDRWKGFASYRINMKTPSPDCEECPVCMDCMVKYEWDHVYGKVIKKTCAKFNDCYEEFLPVITKCQHTFCGVCWDTLLKTNVKEIGYVNHVWDYTKYVSCPMCRYKVIIKTDDPQLR